jgi:glycosyltransferase involved in cell wall biosynthesis
MRILMLSQFYAPMIGGEERHVRDLAFELVKRGHDVAVATVWHDGLPERELDRGVRVYRLRSTSQRFASLFTTERRHVPPAPDPEMTFGLGRVIASERPDVVHAHNWLVHSFLPLKPFSGARLVLTLHDYSRSCAIKRLLHRQTAVCSGASPRKCFTCAGEYYGPFKGLPTVVANAGMSLAENAAVDMFLPVSQSVAAGNGLDGTGLPFRVVPNFIADDVGSPRPGFEDCVAQLPEAGFLLFVGLFERWKGVEVLLQAFAQLPASAPPLVLIGYGALDRLGPRATQVPNVIAFENWPNGAVMEAWRRCAVAIAPSIWPEPCATTVMEAMASGRPIVATRAGGTVDMVADGENGLLVDPGDVNGLRQSLERLLADADLRERMGRASLQRVERFRAGRVVSEIEAVYRELLEAGPGDEPNQSSARHRATSASKPKASVGASTRRVGERPTEPADARGLRGAEWLGHIRPGGAV